MAKMPKNTRAGRALRNNRREAFNPANGEPHTRKFLDSARHKVKHPGRRITYATAERSSR